MRRTTKRRKLYASLETIKNFSMISGTLSSSVDRFLTFELGKGDKESLNQVFSTALFIHIGLALLVFLSIETFGVWFLNNEMDNIPADRLPL